ncbi:MAG: hypothetical protein DMF19_08390 [Verrucomicrobia bacterium]|jgi:hypothetical protein|nr:MAG: hypothetical protein DMF19_08390 [Verrucomicrobiota bacterium]
METGKEKEESISTSALIAMVAIVVGLIVVASYANWQNAHRDRIETTTITRFTPEASASPTP